MKLGKITYPAGRGLDRDIYTIKYNVLNLPDIIQFKNGNQIKNTYDAGGHKLGTEYFTWRPGANAPVVNAGDLLNLSYSQASTDQNGTAYIGNFEYNTLNGNATQTTLSRIYNDEGYVENIASPNYYYYRRDHLGDNREVWCANTNSTVQRTQYYPSGLPWASNDGDNPGKQQRKYNGKEFVEMHGYDTYDIVWRQYYPAIMRFQTPDPEIEDTYNLSPYAMCDNNMVLKTDPDGRVAIVDNLVGAAIGAGIEIGTQMISNALTGDKVTNIQWGKVGVAAVEGFVTDGASNVAKVGVKLAAAAANSYLDNQGKDVKTIAKGAVVNLGISTIAGGASKLMKGMGNKTLTNVSNKMIGSKTQIANTVKNVMHVDSKTAHNVAKTVQATEKAIAKQVGKLPQNITKSAVEATLDKKKKQNE